MIYERFETANLPPNLILLYRQKFPRPNRIESPLAIVEEVPIERFTLSMVDLDLKSKIILF